MSSPLEWVPAEQRLRAALWRGRGHFERGEYFAAYRAFLSGCEAADGEEVELARGLTHLAAAGYKRLIGDERGATRQLAHARRRLEPFRPRHRDLDLDALLARHEFLT